VKGARGGGTRRRSTTGSPHGRRILPGSARPRGGGAPSALRGRRILHGSTRPQGVGALPGASSAPCLRLPQAPRLRAAGIPLTAPHRIALPFSTSWRRRSPPRRAAALRRISLIDGGGSSRAQWAAVLCRTGRHTGLGAARTGPGRSWPLPSSTYPHSISLPPSSSLKVRRGIGSPRSPLHSPSFPAAVVARGACERRRRSSSRPRTPSSLLPRDW
jgi:hypothetical protein